MTRLEAIRDRTRTEIGAAKKKLAHGFLCLAEDLERAAATLENGGTISSVGVIQSSGTDLDRQCGELRVREDSLKALEYLALRDEENG